MAKSKRSANTGQNDPLDIRRPFNLDILDRARAIAATHQIIVRRHDGRFFGHSAELPGAMNDGSTRQACVRNTRDILTTTIATLIERGEIQPGGTDFA